MTTHCFDRRKKELTITEVIDLVYSQEVEQMKRSNTAKEDEMEKRHAIEKKRLPKIQKSEAKTRAQMFKQSLRLSTVGTPEDDRTKMKQVGHHSVLPISLTPNITFLPLTPIIYYMDPVKSFAF